MTTDTQTETPSTPYPEWQAKIRAAQAAARKTKALRKADEDERTFDLQREEAQRFVDMFANAGIAVNPLNVEFVDEGHGSVGDPRVTIDGYEFTYVRRNGMHHLCVIRRLPVAPDLETLDPDAESEYRTVLAVHIYPSFGGGFMASEIADALDEIERRYPEYVEHNQRIIGSLRRKAAGLDETLEEKPLPRYRVLTAFNDEELQSSMNDAAAKGYTFVSMSMTAVDADVYTTVVMALESRIVVEYQS